MRKNSLGLLGVLLSLMLCLPSMAEDNGRAATSNMRVSLRSAYLAQPLGEARVITITGQLGGRGKLTLDGNQCALNAFGDLEGCTEIYFPEIDIRLVRDDVEDPAGLGRQIFRLVWVAAPRDQQLFLVVPRDGDGPYRLVAKRLTKESQEYRAITMEPLRQDHEKTLQGNE